MRLRTGGQQQQGILRIHVSRCVVVGVTKALTHGLSLAKDAQDQEGFEQEEDNNEKQRYKLVEGIESICLVWWIQSRVPVAGPVQSSVEGNVAGADKDDDGRDQEQTNGYRSAVVEELVADGAVEHEYP